MFVCCECCVLSGRGLCDGLITRPEESYRLSHVVVCDQKPRKTRRLKPAIGLWKIQPQWVVTPGKQTNKRTYIHIYTMSHKYYFITQSQCKEICTEHLCCSHNSTTALKWVSVFLRAFLSPEPFRFVSLKQKPTVTLSLSKAQIVAKRRKFSIRFIDNHFQYKN
jgi:hypothetical protein